MSNAPAVLLLHGFTGMGASWQPVTSGLPTRYRVLAPDIRGHGPDPRLPASLDAVLDDIELALDQAGITDRLVVGGYSMGGRLALHAALRFADRVQELLLIGASPGLAHAEERALRRQEDEQLATEFEQLQIDELAARWERTPVLSGLDPHLAALARQVRVQSTPQGLAAALRGLGTGALPPLWDALAQIGCPVTLVAGERDTKFTAIAERMGALIPNSELVIAAGSGHSVALEQPLLIRDLLLRALSR